REGNRRKRRRKLRKSETEPATGKTKTEAEYYPEEIHVEGEKRLELETAWGTKWRNWTQGRGRNGGKHERTRAERSVEEVVSDRGEEW
ncbi:MAG: hypothetical protein CMA85_03525, partial [Euryarchaeota archaeon]|nr:hypothetical protein [Euryarchaeota archaeon]